MFTSLLIMLPLSHTAFKGNAYRQVLNYLGLLHSLYLRKGKSPKSGTDSLLILDLYTFCSTFKYITGELYCIVFCFNGNRSFKHCSVASFSDLCITGEFYQKLFGYSRTIEVEIYSKKFSTS